MKNNIIVDASVIVRALTTKDSEQLARTKKKLAENNLYAIPHLMYEVNNAIGKHFRKDLIKRIEYYFNFTQIPITIIKPTDEDYRLTHFISMTLDESFYDSCYHATAIMRGYTYITFDKKYFRSGTQFEFIELLS